MHRIREENIHDEKRLHEKTIFSAAFTVYMRETGFYNGAEHEN